MEIAERHSEVTLSGAGAIKVFKAGHKAMFEIKGLRGLVFRALLLNYLIFSGATLLLNGLFYYLLLNPIIHWLFGGGEGFWASLGTVILWSIQLTVAAAFAVVALRFSVSLVTLWNQSLVERVIYHFREIEESTFAKLSDIFRCNINLKRFVLLPISKSSYKLAFRRRRRFLGFPWDSNFVECSVDGSGSICCCSFTFFRVTGYSLESEFG